MKPPPPLTPPARPKIVQKVVDDDEYDALLGNAAEDGSGGGGGSTVGAAADAGPGSDGGDGGGAASPGRPVGKASGGVGGAGRKVKEGGNRQSRRQKGKRTSQQAIGAGVSGLSEADLAGSAAAAGIMGSRKKVLNLRRLDLVEAKVRVSAGAHLSEIFPGRC